MSVHLRSDSGQRLEKKRMRDGSIGKIATPLSLLQHLRRSMDAAGARLHVDRWFPHAVLALALLIAGLYWLGDAVSGNAAALLSPTAWRHLDLVAVNLRVTDVIHGIAGIMMIVMSVGIVLRSRLSWTLAVILLVAVELADVRTHRHLALFVYYNAALLIGLLLAWSRFNRSSIAAGTLFAITSTLMLMLYAVFGTYYLGADFHPPITDLVTALYYAVVTMSTVGYGDIAPQTPEARLFAVSIIVLGITVFATSLGAIVAPVISGGLQRIIHRKGKRMVRQNHFIIVGNTSLARNTYQEMRQRDLPVTLILPEAPAAAGELAGADVIVGDASNVDVLRSAGATDARAVLAMRADDSDNAFIVLAVKELEGSVKTVAAVNDSKNYGRVQRVQPDMIIAPQILGGELLAMALAGESIDGDAVMKRFFNM
jgi:voltage-gated potassium channel